MNLKRLYWYHLCVELLEAAAEGDAALVDAIREELAERHKPPQELKDALLDAADELLAHQGGDDEEDEEEHDLHAAVMVAQILGHSPRVRDSAEQDLERFRKELDGELLRMLMRFHPDRVSNDDVRARVLELSTEMTRVLNQMRAIIQDDRA